MENYIMLGKYLKNFSFWTEFKLLFGLSGKFSRMENGKKGVTNSCCSLLLLSSDWNHFTLMKLKISIQSNQNLLIFEFQLFFSQLEWKQLKISCSEQKDLRQPRWYFNRDVTNRSTESLQVLRFWNEKYIHIQFKEINVIWGFWEVWGGSEITVGSTPSPLFTIDPNEFKYRESSLLGKKRKSWEWRNSGTQPNQQHFIIHNDVLYIVRYTNFLNESYLAYKKIKKIITQLLQKANPQFHVSREFIIPRFDLMHKIKKQFTLQLLISIWSFLCVFCWHLI